MYLLDTDIMSYFLKGNVRVTENFRRHQGSIKALSVITYAELLYGCRNSQYVTENLAKVGRLVANYPIIDVTCPVVECFGEIKAYLTKAGTPLEDFDVLIGCTALTMNYTVVTNNVKHYQKIPGLKIVNWA